MAAFLFLANDGVAKEPEAPLALQDAAAGVAAPIAAQAAPRTVALASLRVPDLAVALPPWRRFASVARVAVGQPAIAIVVDDLGGSAYQVERVLALDAALTLAFLPGGLEAPALARRARRDGHEVLLHIPMEPDNPELDPGEGALTVDQSDDVLRQTLEWSLDRFGGYVGVNNHMGSRFTSDRRAMSVVLAEIKARGLLFLDSKTTRHSTAPELADALDLPNVARDVFIDAAVEPGAIAYQLERLERLARERGIAVAIGHPHEATLAALENWLPDARARGFAIVPISYAVALRCGC